MQKVNYSDTTVSGADTKDTGQLYKMYLNEKRQVYKVEKLNAEKMAELKKDETAEWSTKVPPDQEYSYEHYVQDADTAYLIGKLRTVADEYRCFNYAPKLYLTEYDMKKAGLPIIRLP